MKKRKKGLLISFEGGEGAGKTVQIKLLADELREKGRDVVITREPGGTVISEKIRKVLLDRENIGMAFTTEVLLFQAARAQIYRELILPSLKAGKIVLCDRTRDSSVVYQGIVRGFGEKLIEQLHKISTKNTYPDVTILLDVAVDIGLSRVNNHGREINRLDLEKKDFHEKVKKAYLKLAKRNDRKRWIVIDASESIEEIHEEVLEKLKGKGII